MKQDLIKRFHMLPEEGLVLCAVSGGRDSMCLLAWLRELGERYGFSVAAAHFDHGLRGEAAARDAQFVRDWCAQQRIPCRVGQGDTASAAAEHGWSIEEAARELRYAFLDRTAEELGAVRIATAHQMEDNAETVLLNLTRGTGLRGLTGIAPVRGIYIRPLLETSRGEIEGYLAFHNIPYVDDETNAELICSRNKIRHTVLPRLRELNPQAVECICQTAALLREEDAYLDRAAERLEETVRLDDGAARIRRDALNELPIALRRRVVRRMLDLLEISKKDVTARHIRDCLHLAAESGPAAQLSLPRGAVARNEYGDFCITSPRRGRCTETPLPPVGEVRTGSWRIVCRIVCGGAEPRQGRLLLNNAALTLPPVADAWRGDGRLTLPGQTGSRSLKRLFRDAGMDLRQREDALVVYLGSRPIAALGVGVDAAFDGGAAAVQYVLDFYRR